MSQFIAVKGIADLWLVVIMLHKSCLNTLQWNLNQYTKRFFYENAYENVDCEMASILSRGDRLNEFKFHFLNGLYVYKMYDSLESKIFCIAIIL